MKSNKLKTKFKEQSLRVKIFMPHFTSLGLQRHEQYSNLIVFILLPFLYFANNSGFASMLLLFILEFIFLLLLYFLIDSYKYGRNRILIYTSTLLLISTLGLSILKNRVLFIGFVSIKAAERALATTINI